MNRLQTGPRLVCLICRDLAEDTIKAIHQALGTRRINLELTLKGTPGIEGTQRQIGPAAASVQRFAAATC